MEEITVSSAQANMREGYLCGAPGVLVSGVVWLIAGVVAVSVSHRAAVFTLLVGGAAIHPVGVLVAKLLGGRGTHATGNPLGRLAAEGTVWLLAGIAMAYGVHMLRLEWFFPSMLLLVGGRYLTFQTVYGLRAYWVLGGALCVLGVLLALARAPAHVSAIAGGVAEVVFAALLFRRAKNA